MKTCRLLALMAAMFLTLVSCDSERYSYLPDSHWIVRVDGVAEGHRLSLTFHDRVMEVRDASTHTQPLSTGRWDYGLDDDGMLHMSRVVYDGDDSRAETYVLRCITDEPLHEMTLVWEPWFGPQRTYNFDRR